MFKPYGIYSAMLTPFKEDGNVNQQVLKKMVDFMIAKGLHGIFPVSTSGEFPHMSFEQAVEVMEIVVEQNAGRVKITPGVSSTCAENSIRLAYKAKELGCDGVVICPPYFYTISDENIEKHIETVAAAVDIPVILYSIPLFAPPISRDVVKRLSKKPNIVAMKDSSGSMVEALHYMDMVRNEGSDINFLVGREDILAPALMMGAKGCMTACAHIVPEIMVGIWDAYHGNDWEKAKRLQFAILPIIRAMFSAPFPAGFKFALEMRGFEMGPLKQPLGASSEKLLSEAEDEIRAHMSVLLKLIETERLDK